MFWLWEKNRILIYEFLLKGQNIDLAEADSQTFLFKAKA